MVFFSPKNTLQPQMSRRNPKQRLARSFFVGHYPVQGIIIIKVLFEAPYYYKGQQAAPASERQEWLLWGCKSERHFWGRASTPSGAKRTNLRVHVNKLAPNRPFSHTSPEGRQKNMALQNDHPSSGSQTADSKSRPSRTTIPAAERFHEPVAKHPQIQPVGNTTV